MGAFGGRAVELESREISFGPEGTEDLAIALGEPTELIHIAFAAPDVATVDRFCGAAPTADGRDNGGPGLRRQRGGGRSCPPPRHVPTASAARA